MFGAWALYDDIFAIHVGVILNMISVVFHSNEV